MALGWHSGGTRGLHSGGTWVELGWLPTRTQAALGWHSGGCRAEVGECSGSTRVALGWPDGGVAFEALGLHSGGTGGTRAAVGRQPVFVLIRSSVAVWEASDDAEDENMSDEDCGAGGGGGSGIVASSCCGAATSIPGAAGSGAASWSR